MTFLDSMATRNVYARDVHVQSSLKRSSMAHGMLRAPQVLTPIPAIPHVQVLWYDGVRMSQFLAKRR
jgi:hypothetical protein